MNTYFLKVFDGNTDRNTGVTSLFPRPIQATHIRIRPTAWESYISMRFEILGCQGTLYNPRLFPKACFVTSQISGVGSEIINDDTELLRKTTFMAHTTKSSAYTFL